MDSRFIEPRIVAPPTCTYNVWIGFKNSTVVLVGLRIRQTIAMYKIFSLVYKEAAGYMRLYIHSIQMMINKDSVSFFVIYIVTLFLQGEKLEEDKEVCLSVAHTCT